MSNYTTWETMALGKALVATAVGGTADLVDDEETGRLLPLGDVEAMAEAIRALAADRERAHRLGLNGRRKIERLLRDEIFIERLEEIYDAAAAHCGRRGGARAAVPA